MSEETIKVTSEYIVRVSPIIVDGRAVPNPVVESLGKLRLPTKPHYWIRRALERVSQLFKVLEETRQEKVRQHGKKDAEGELLIVMKDFAKIKPLMDETDMTISSLKNDSDFVYSDLDTALKGEGVSPKVAKKIAEWSEDKISAEGNGNIIIENMMALQKELDELMEIEEDLGIKLIEIDMDNLDKEHGIDPETKEKVYRFDVPNGNEMSILCPLLKVDEKES